MIIVCGDTQIRMQYPYFSAQEQFLLWLRAQEWNTPENTFIHLGDFFDSSALTGKLVHFAQKWWSVIKCKKILLQGNHDTSRRLGSALDFLEEVGVEVVKQQTEGKIEDNKCLFLPYPVTRDLEEEYKQATGNYDFVFGHFAVLPLFGHELPLHEDLQYRHRLFGHVHIPDANDPVYLGVPVAQTYGEDIFQHHLACIDQKKLSYIDVPPFLKYESLDYNSDAPVSSFNQTTKIYTVYDIVNAPSVKLAYEKFNNIFIRKVTTLLSQEAPEIGDKGLLEHGRDTLIEEFLSKYDKPSVANKLRALFS